MKQFVIISALLLFTIGTGAATFNAISHDYCKDYDLILGEKVIFKYNADIVGSVTNCWKYNKVNVNVGDKNALWLISDIQR